MESQRRDLPDQLTRVRELLGRGLAEARRMIGELRPMIIDEQGIVEAIHYLAAKEKEDGDLHVDFQHNVAVGRLDPILEGTGFRIVQEALTNVKRHSQSDRMIIRLTEKDGRIRLHLEDQGRGFDPRQIPDDRFAVRGIHERARLFGGSAVVDGAPGEGTRITVELPLVESAGGGLPDG